MVNERVDFANILFSGPCNLRCPDCIGRSLGPRFPSNLDRFPLAGIDQLIRTLQRDQVREVSVSGTNTDPQLYEHEPALLELLREKVQGVRISLHTNGLLALAKMDTFNQYDRATISIPSFRPEVYRALTGGRRPPSLEAIVERSRIRIKLSMLLTKKNLAEVPEILDRARRLGIDRVVLRRRYGESLALDPFPGVDPVRTFAGNPIFELGGLEVTVWDFGRSRLRCVNLLSDGRILEEYDLAMGLRGLDATGLRRLEGASERGRWDSAGAAAEAGSE